MVSNEEYFKREDDRKWRARVDDRLAALTAGETVQNDRLDEIDEEFTTIRTIIDGKAEDKDDNGIKGDIHELNVTMNQLRAIMAPDSLGQGGVISRLRALERKAGLEQVEIEGRWKFYGVLTAAILSLAGLIVTNLEPIEHSLKRILSAVIATDSTTPAKHGTKTLKRRRRPPVNAALVGEPHGLTPEMPEGRSGDGSDSK